MSFADDTTLCMSNSNFQALFLVANKRVNKLFHWFCTNRLSLNQTKTKYIVIRPHQQQCNFTGLNVAIHNNILKGIGNGCEETFVKFLGSFLDENLSWKYHMAHVNKRISSALFSIKQVQNILPKDYLRTLYFHWYILIYIMEYWHGEVVMSKYYTVQYYFRNGQFGLSIMQNSIVTLTHYSKLPLL